MIKKYLLLVMFGLLNLNGYAGDQHLAFLVPRPHTYETVSYQVKYNEGNDDLGQDNVNYFDPIIKRTISGGANPVYEVKMYNTGQVQMIILPAKR